MKPVTLDLSPFRIPGDNCGNKLLEVPSYIVFQYNWGLVRGDTSLLIRDRNSRPTKISHVHFQKRLYKD